MRSSGPLFDWCTAIASTTISPTPPLREAHVARADVVVDDAVLARQARDHRRQTMRFGSVIVLMRERGEEQAHGVAPPTSAPPMMSFWISVVPS